MARMLVRQMCFTSLPTHDFKSSLTDDLLLLQPLNLSL